MTETISDQTEGTDRPDDEKGPNRSITQSTIGRTPGACSRSLELPALLEVEDCLEKDAAVPGGRGSEKAATGERLRFTEELR
jgi:hypothetical protein